MTEKGTAVIDELLQSLEDAGYVVVEVGARYRVTNPKGGDVAFIPKRLPKNANFSLVLQGLVRIGFDVAAAEKAREDKRLARLAADRLKGEALLREAEASAQLHQLEREQGATTRTPPPAVRAFRVPQPPEPETPVVEGGPQPRTEIIDFTPDFARALLASNRFYEEGVNHAGRCNRRYRPMLAQRYADAMLRGEWVITGETIGQDIEGELTNGQHRLMGVVIAGETKPDIVIPMMFAYDLPVAARDHVDSGMRRTLGDNLSMQGEKDPLVLSAVLRLLHAHDHVPFSYKAWREQAAPISIEQARIMLQLEPSIRESAQRGSTASKGSKMIASALGVGIVLARRVWPDEDVWAFVEKLHTGANLEPGDAILALRSLLAKQKERRQLRLAPDHLALFVKTWNLHHGGHRRVVIKWSDVEAFPEIVPPSTRSGYRDRRPTGSSDPS